MTDAKISYQDHLRNMEEFRPYREHLEGQSEMEEAVEYLLNFPSVEYLGEEFEQAYYKAVRDQLEWFKENAVIKETKEEVRTTIKSYKYMEYRDE